MIRIEPREGTIMVLGAPHRKAGKSLMMIELIIRWLNRVKNGISYNNFHLDHERAFYKKRLTPGDFPLTKGEDIPVLVGIQEADLLYPPQYWAKNLDLFVFAGVCAHLNAGMLLDFQNDYRLPRDVYNKVNNDLTVYKTLRDEKTDKPYRILFGIKKPLRKRAFKFTPKYYDRYDCREYPLPIIDFSSFIHKRVSQIEEDQERQNGKKTLQCQNCNYVWNPKTANPLSCPSCRTRFGFNVVRT